MKTPEDPPRWSDGADAPLALGSLLSAAKRDVATDAELSELEARLKPMLNAQPSAAPTFLKLAGGLVALVGLGAVIIALRQPRAAAPPAASARPIAVAPVATGSGPGLQSALPHASSSSASVEVDSGAPGTPSVAAPQKPLVGGTVGGTAPAARASNPAQAEATLLEQARAALSASPAQALRLAQQHAQQFPHGLLTQEREVIAISALRRLGRTTEADARAARFDARYPHSLHQQAVDRPSPQ